MNDTNKLLSLDITRGAACLLVWLGHLRVSTHYFSGSQYDFIQVFTSWGWEAVVVFFLLSGVVINLSTRNIKSRKEYYKRRFLRIYPIYFVVLCICFLCDHFIFQHPVKSSTLIGNVLLSGTLQGYIADTLPMDGVVWSITCEAFFYLLYGLADPSRRIPYIWAWLGVSLASILYSIAHSHAQTGIAGQVTFLLNNSFLWLIGYLAFEYRRLFNISPQAALFSILMVPMVTRLQNLPGNVLEMRYLLAGVYVLPLFLYFLRHYRIEHETKRLNLSLWYFCPFYLINLFLLWNFSGSLISNKVCYSAIPLLSLPSYFQPVMGLLVRLYHGTGRLLLKLARISYPLYLIHAPTMFVVFHFLPNQPLIGMSLSVMLTLLLSIVLEVYLYERLRIQKSKDIAVKKETVLH